MKRCQYLNADQSSTRSKHNVSQVYLKFDGTLQSIQSTINDLEFDQMK